MGLPGGFSCGGMVGTPGVAGGISGGSIGIQAKLPGRSDVPVDNAQTGRLAFMWQSLLCDQLISVAGAAAFVLRHDGPTNLDRDFQRTRDAPSNSAWTFVGGVGVALAIRHRSFVEAMRGDLRFTVVFRMLVLAHP